MFFDVTRAGTDRRLRVAVAAIAFLDTLPIGSVLHLVGGQSLHVGETVAEIEERALAARPVTALQSNGRIFDPTQTGRPRSQVLPPVSTDPATRDPASDTIDWTEVLASPIAAQPAAELLERASKQRRRRQEKAA